MAKLRPKRKIKRGDYVRAPDGFEGFVMGIGDHPDPRGGPSGVLMADVKGPQGSKKYPPKELKMVDRPDVGGLNG